MRALVYGPYPPMPGAAPAGTLRSVRELVAAGADVEVVSPVPSAAHHHALLSRPDGAMRFLRAVVGADEVVLHLDPLPFATPSAKARAGRAALGAALRRPRRVAIHLPALNPVPPAGWVSAVLGAADRVLVASEGDRAALVAAGLPAGKVEVRGPGSHADGPVAPPAGVDRASPVGEPWALPEAPTREEIQAEVERRAAARRRAAAATARSQAVAVDRSRALRALPPLGRAPARSAKPGVGAVKRAVQRLVAWQVDPIIEHVNRLQRATVEAVEGGDADAGPPSRL